LDGPGFIALVLGLAGRVIVNKNRRDHAMLDERRRIVRDRLPEQWRSAAVPAWLRVLLGTFFATVLVVGKVTAGTPGALAAGVLVVIPIWAFSLLREAARRRTVFEAVEVEAQDLPPTELRGLI
jgi:Flp pilus assembly protein TadB